MHHNAFQLSWLRLECFESTPDNADNVSACGKRTIGGSFVATFCELRNNRVPVFREQLADSVFGMKCFLCGFATTRNRNIFQIWRQATAYTDSFRRFSDCFQKFQIVCIVQLNFLHFGFVKMFHCVVSYLIYGFN